jgi:hypothetical protein
MLIRLRFDIQFEIPSPVAMVVVYHVHHYRRADLREPDDPRITPHVPLDEYEDSFGNVCTRFVGPAGKLRLYHSTLIEDSGKPDETGCLRRSPGRMPIFPAPGDNVLPLLEHPGPVCSRISGRHRCPSGSTDGFQRMVRGLPGRPVVDIRRS